MMALTAGLISPEAAGVPRCNDKIGRATAALRADQANRPCGDGNRHHNVRLVRRDHIDPVPAAVAPGAQQQTALAVLPSVAGPEALS